MRYSRLVLWLFAGFVAVVCATATQPAAVAAEPAEAFLQGLEDRGLYDMAFAYLDDMRSSPLCPKEFREIIDYKAGVVLVAKARSIRSLQRRAAELDVASERLQKFLAEHPKHNLASNATTQLANVLVERGRMLVNDAHHPSATPEEKTKLLEQARGLYAQAKEIFNKAEQHYVEQLESMPQGLIDRKETKLLEARSQARGDLLQSRLFSTTVVYETAMTYPADSKDRKQLLLEAAKQYNALYEKYSAWLAGLYARMWEGRCYKELGDNQKALKIFDELLAQADEPAAFRQLKNKALVLSLQTSLDPEVKQYKPAIDNFGDWMKTSRGNEQSSSDGLAIKYLAAAAHLEYARPIKEKDPRRRDSILAARGLLEFVGRFEGDHQKAAKAKLADPLLGMKTDEQSELSNFDEAQQCGKSALDRMQALEMQAGLEHSQSEHGSRDADAEQIAQARTTAVDCFQTALAMVTPETPVDDVNLARYYLAYLYWSSGDAYRAAVLGEFLATRYPQSLGGRQGAKIALAAYSQLFNRAKPRSAERAFAKRHMAALADYITKSWPQSPEASDAWVLLMRQAVAAGNLPAAVDILAKLPADSPRRGEAELLLGRAYWAEYLRLMQMENGAQPTEDEQAKAMAEAKRLLRSGIEHSDPRSVDASLFASALSLAQIYLRDSQPAAAVKLLENTKIGPLALVAKKHPAAAQPGYDIETYKTALRAYVAARDLEKAEATMDVLEQAVGAEGDATSAARLTQIYIGLGRELQDLLQTLRKQNKQTELQAVSEGFELFLNRIFQRPQGNTFNSLNWVAETFFGMGSGFDQGEETLTPEAGKYYQKAADAYRTILKKCKADKNFAPEDNAADGIKLRLAKCLTRLGQYETAMRYLVSVLIRRNTIVDAQVQAAQTFQDWASTPGNANRYANAITGGYRSKTSNKNVVWGWMKISKLTAVGRRHADIFHEARYNMALCQMKMAMGLSGQEKKDALAAAENSITKLHMLYPQMGGPQWRKKYESLLKKIQKLQHKPATSLAQ